MNLASILLALVCAQFCVACSTSAVNSLENFSYKDVTGKEFVPQSKQAEYLRQAMEASARIERIDKEMNDDLRTRNEALRFTRRTANALQEELNDTTIEISVQKPLNIQTDPSSGVLIYEDFIQCRKDSNACSAVIDRFVKGYAPILRSRIIFMRRESVRLAIREGEYIKRLQESLGQDVPSLQVEPLLGGLLLLAVMDRPPTPVPLDDRSLERLHLSHKQLFALGRENLQKKLAPFPSSAKAAAQGEIGVLNGSEFESSRLLLHSQWEPLANAQKGTLLIALPTNDTVLYISESTSAATDALRTAASRRLASAPNALSTIVLKWNSTGWETVN